MAKKKKKNLWQRAKAWFKETFTPHKENKKVSNNTSFGRAVNRIQQKAQAGYERTYGSSGSTTVRQAQGQRTSAPSSVSARKAESKAKSNSWKPEKKISVAEVMKAQIKPTESTFDKATKKAKEQSEKKSDLTAREQALKKRVQQATHVVGNRVGKDFAKEAKSGIYNVKATKKEKANVAKSIEKDYNKKSGKQKFVAGLTKSDANVRIATKAITGKNIKTNKVTKSKAYKAGDITQEMASYAIAPTGAVEKGLGKAAVKAGAKKLLKAEGKKATKEAVAKVSETVAKDLAKNKVRTFARKRAADTIANAGFNAKYAASRARDENGKVDKKEAVKDFAINTGLDIGIGSGLDALKGRKGRVLARESKMNKSLNKRLQKIEKKTSNKLASKASESKSAITNVKKGKSAVSKSEANIGEAIQKEYAGIERRRELGKISRLEAKRQRKALAKVAEQKNGKDSVLVRTADGFKKQRITAKGLEDVGETIDRRFKGNAKSIGAKRIRERIAQQPKGIRTVNKTVKNDFRISDADKKRIAENLRKNVSRNKIKSAKKTKAIEEYVDKVKADREAKALQAKEAKEQQEAYDFLGDHIIGTKQQKKSRAVAKAKEAVTEKAEAGKQVKKSHAYEAKEEVPKVKEYVATTRRTKGQSDLDYGDTVKRAFDNIDKKASKGDITNHRAKQEKEAVAEAVRKRTGSQEITVRGEDGTARKAKITKDGLQDAGKVERSIKAKARRIVEKEEYTPTRSQEQLTKDRKRLVDELYDASTKDVSAEERKRIQNEIADVDKDLAWYKSNKGATPKAEPKAEAKAEQTVQEPTSTITAEKTAKSTNTPTAKESTLKSSETSFEDIPNFYEEDARALEEKASEAEATLRKNAEAEDAEKAMQGAEEYDPIKDMVDTMAKREPGIHLPGSFEEPERAKAVLDGRRARAEETAQAEADFVDAATQQYKEGEKEAARQASKERTAKMDEHLRGEKTEATKAETPEAETPKEKSDPIKDKIGRPEKRSLEAKVNQFLTDARRKFINSLGFSERYAEKLANEGKMPKEFADTFRGNANNLRQATQRAKNSFADMQQDFNGNEVGESFMTIARDTASKGKEHYSNTEKYCFLLTHADRMDLAASKELDNLMGEYRKIEKAIEGKKIKEEKGEELLEELRQRMDEIEEVGLEDSRANKRVFDNLTADEARAEAQKILDADPEVAKDAERIFNYFRNDLMSQVQAGLISEDTFRFYLNKMPNYVPAHRAFERAGYSIGGDATKLRPDELRAKGSGRVVLPMEDQALMSAEYTFTRGAQNEVAKQIAEMSGYSPRLLDAFDDADGVNALDLAMFYDFDRGTLQFWDKGKMRSVDVDKNFLKDLQDMQVTSVQAEALNATLQALGKGNRVFKSLITNFNPAFAVKNGIRDWPEGAFQSQDMMKYLKNYVSGKAAASILTNDEWYRAFKRMGVQNAQLVNNAEDIFKDENWFKKNTIGRVADMNEFVETLPRLSEFISFLEKRGKTPVTATADEMRQAGEAAADVTVNFGRSGSIGRIINSSLIPFFNPAMQGWSKIARVLTKDKSVKGYLNLIAKGAMLGVAPAAVNEWLLSDNKNYQMINERDRAVNYYIPLDKDNPLNKLFGSTKSGVKDGEVFLKIPKARFLSILGMGTQKAMGTTDIPWADIVSISKDQIGPVGWENNIFKPAMDSAITDEKSKGKTWYGADIETDYDQKREAPDRYDVNTSKIGIEIGKKLGVSPKKVDYLIDSYTGVLGDIALPASKKAAGRTGGGVGGAVQGYLAKNFSTDTVSQNNLTTKMYDRIDKLTKKKNSGDTSGKTEYGLWYLDKHVAKDASEIRKQIREIQDSDKSKNQKAKEIRPLQRKLNKITKTGIDTEKDFVKEAKKRIANLKDTDLDKDDQKKYGLENAMIATADKRGENPWKIVNKAFKENENKVNMAKYAKKAGMDPLKFKEFYNIKAYDYDKSGRASKAELISYLNSRDDLTAQEKAILFAGTNKLFVKWGGNPFGDVGGGNNTKTAKSGGGRRRYGRRRYGRRRYGRRGYSSKNASGGTPQKAPAKLKQTQAEKVSVASVMKTASAPSGTAQQKLIRSTTGNNAYTNAVKSVKSKKARKDIYKIKASKA